MRTRKLVQAHLDQRLSDGEFAELESLLEKDSTARATYAELARLDAGLRDIGEIVETQEVISIPKQKPWPAVAAIAALLTIFIGFLALAKRSEPTDSFSENLPATEIANGIAVITAEAGAQWEQSHVRPLGEGSTLEPGRYLLKEGLAQIDFFGGASVSLSSPAEIELIDRDSAILHRGTLRAEVPPAARGFEIRTGDVLLEDLGTSFGLAVSENEKSELIVFDGEVRATGLDGEPINLFGGDSALLDDGVALRKNTDAVGPFPDITDVIAGSGDREEYRYAAWRKQSLARRSDPRLIAYYDFESLTMASRRLKNRAVGGLRSEADGGIVGAKVSGGRWPQKTALDFRSEGDRVRFHIPGEFENLTLYAWVRIDALDRHLNSLFLTDYFDENEIHWQISKMGALHFACSPMGVEDIPKHNRRFYSEPFWNPEMSGRWFMLATSIDRSGGGSGVTHFVNGKALGFSGGTNRLKPLPAMRIGDADLGNWSDPIWPNGSIRTLNGRIDEFALFNAALSTSEIQEIFETGKP